MAIDTEALRARERLLTEGLAAAPNRDQRRVQTALLRETRDDLAAAERAARAVAAGWEPFEPSPDWYAGWLEDPRFLRGHTRLAAIVLAAALAIGFAALTRGDILPAVLGGLVIFLAVQAGLREVPVPPRWDRLGEGTPLIFNAPLPAQAAVAYRRARGSGLFDTFTVHSPRAQDFRAVAAAEAPSLGLLDPVLAGHIGRHSFLVAQWDLATDLAEV